MRESLHAQVRASLNDRPGAVLRTKIVDEHTPLTVAVLAIAMGSLVSSAHAQLEAETTKSHDHDQDVTYQLHTPTLSSTQGSAIDAMATAWDSRMGEADGGLDFHRGADITTGTDEPSGWNQLSPTINAIWEDEYPSLFVGCDGVEGSDPTGAAACTRVQGTGGTSEGGHNHHQSCLSSNPNCQLDTVFEEDIAWPSDGSECTLGGDVDQRNGMGGYDFRGAALDRAS